VFFDQGERALSDYLSDREDANLHVVHEIAGGFQLGRRTASLKQFNQRDN
jgi:hypothetical protein